MESDDCQRLPEVAKVNLQRFRSALRHLACAATLTLLLAGVAAAKTKVVYWDKWGSGSDMNAIMTMVKAFNEAQNEIEVEYVAPGDILTKFITAAAGNAAPDIIGMWNHQTAPMTERGLIRPLDEMVRSSGLRLNSVIPNFVVLSQYKGNLYQLPALPSVITLMWNRAVFAEAGLDPNTPPRTLDEFDAFDRRLTKIEAGQEIKRVGFSPFFPNWWPYLWAWLDGGSLWDPEQGRITAADPKVVAGYQFIQNLVERHSQGNAARFRGGWGDYMTPFIDGKLGMVLMGSWVPKHITDVGPDTEYGVTPIPAGPRGERFSLFEADTWAIPTGAKQPQAAMRFLAWMYLPENATRFAGLRNQFSVVREVNTPDFFRKAGGPGLAAFAQVAIGTAARQAPNMPIWDEYGGALGAATNDIMALRAAPETRLGQVQREVQSKLDEALKKRR